MLKLSAYVKMISEGYQFDDYDDMFAEENENRRKYVQILATLDFLIIKIKIPPHKEMHIKSINDSFPYIISENEDGSKWVTIQEFHFNVPYKEILEYIEKRCREVWFV